MADTVILAEQQFSTVQIPDLGLYGMDVPANIELAVGETYNIVFDGETYSCICQDTSGVISGSVAVGNGAAFGLSGNNEPFAVLVYSNATEATVFCFLDTEPTSHTIAIYYREEDTAIVVKDRDGNPVQHTATAVNLLMQDGTEQIFVPETDMPEVVESTIDPDTIGFVNGDIVVAPEDGKVFSEVTVKKPANLIPENIAEGVNIAGIVGTLAAGGGGKVNAITKFVTLSDFKNNTTVELISAAELAEAGLTFPTTAYCFALMFVPERTYDSFATYSYYHLAYCFIGNNAIAYSTSTGAFYGDIELHTCSSSGNHGIANTQLKKNYFGTANTNGLCYIDGAIKCVVNSSTYLKKNYIVVAGYVEKP